MPKIGDRIPKERTPASLTELLLLDGMNNHVATTGEARAVVQRERRKLAARRKPRRGRKSGAQR